MCTICINVRVQVFALKSLDYAIILLSLLFTSLCLYNNNFKGHVSITGNWHPISTDRIPAVTYQ